MKLFSEHFYKLKKSFSVLVEPCADQKNMLERTNLVEPEIELPDSLGDITTEMFFSNFTKLFHVQKEVEARKSKLVLFYLVLSVIQCVQLQILR